jgi:hypothetical protein
MPAIASLEDLNAAKKEGLSISAMLSALCSMLYALCSMLYAFLVTPRPGWLVLKQSNPRRLTPYASLIAHKNRQCLRKWAI